MKNLYRDAKNKQTNKQKFPQNSHFRENIKHKSTENGNFQNLIDIFQNPTLTLKYVL